MIVCLRMEGLKATESTEKNPASRESLSKRVMLLAFLALASLLSMERVFAQLGKKLVEELPVSKLIQNPKFKNLPDSSLNTPEVLELQRQIEQERIEEALSLARKTQEVTLNDSLLTDDEKLEMIKAVRRDLRIKGDIFDVESFITTIRQNNELKGRDPYKFVIPALLFCYEHGLTLQELYEKHKEEWGKALTEYIHVLSEHIPVFEELSPQEIHEYLVNSIKGQVGQDSLLLILPPPSPGTVKFIYTKSKGEVSVNLRNIPNTRNSK